METKVEIHNLRKQFGPFTAVDGISFQVGRGEVLGFLGPNGAGKSTTMKMVTGFLTPTDGTAVVCGDDITRNPLAAKRHMGYLPEGAPGYADMTPTGFLRFIAEIRGFRGAERDRRVAEVMERVHLLEVAHQPIDTLSKGYKRRVGLAQAILHDPQVLILDEPTDGLDPNQKHEVRNLIREMAEEKVIILSTHILEEVDAVCNRAIIIAHGRVVADGTPGELEARSRYHNAVVLRLPEGRDAPGIEGLPDVAGVEREEDGDTGGVTLRLLPREGRPILEEVTAWLRERAIEPLELYVEQGRLDDVFRTLTTHH